MGKEKKEIPEEEITPPEISWRENDTGLYWDREMKAWAVVINGRGRVGYCSDYGGAQKMLMDVFFGYVHEKKHYFEV